MASSSFLRSGMLLLTGVVAGVIIGVGVISFAQDNSSSSVDIFIPVNVKKASSAVINYLNDARPVSMVLKSYTISKVQYEAMGKIAENNKGYSGFRIYPGKNLSGEMIGIVIGLNDSGKEDTLHPIFETKFLKTGPCPDYCDEGNTVILR
jgi:hypothetical protein